MESAEGGIVSEHPHFGHTRLGLPVHARVRDHHKGGFNKRLAILITTMVGSMQCAYAFGLLALASLPAILTQAFHLHVFPGWLINASLIALVAWLSSYFLQLVLLPVVIVGQNVQAEATDARAAKTFEDAEAAKEALVVALDRLDLDTVGGLAVIYSEVRDAKAAAETAAEAMKMLTSVIGAKTLKSRDTGRRRSYAWTTAASRAAPCHFRVDK